MSLTQEKRNSIKECFDYYDRDGDEKIKTDDLGKVMRSLGYGFFFSLSPPLFSPL